MTSVRYSCKTLQTSNMNDIIILVKIVKEKTENKKTRKQEETLIPDSDHRLQRINAG